MRIRSVIVTLIGLGIAGGSMLYAKSILEAPHAANASTSDLAEVVVAGKDIEFGQAIEAHMLATQTWPREALPAGAFTSIDEVVAEIGQDPRRAKRVLAQGELVLASKVSNFGEKVTIVQALGENTRAMAIEVDAVTGVGGFVTPGDHVDVVLTEGRNGDDLRAVTILQNIRVIGVDQTADEQNDQPGIARTITVEVTPADGQKLALAQQAGTLSLTLRTVNSVSDRPLDLINLSDLMLDKSPVPELAAKKPTVRIRRANVVETVEVGG